MTRGAKKTLRGPSQPCGLHGPCKVPAAPRGRLPETAGFMEKPLRESMKGPLLSHLVVCSKILGPKLAIAGHVPTEY